MLNTESLGKLWQMIKEGKWEQWKRKCRAEELQDKAREKDFFSVLLGPIYPTMNQYQDALDKYILKRTTETKKISQFTAVLVRYYFNNIKKIPMDCQLEGRRFQHKPAGTLPGQELHSQAAILEWVLASERLCWSSKSFSSLDFPVTRAGAPAEAPLKHTLAACLPARVPSTWSQQTRTCLANHRVTAEPSCLAG